MNALIGRLRLDKIVYYSSSVSLLLIILSSALVGIFYRLIPPIIPLYNQMPWGEARLGAKGELFFVVGYGIALYIINLILSNYLYNSLPLLSRILSITTVLGSLFVFFIVARTILILT